MTKEDFGALGRFLMAIIALAAAGAFLLPTSAQVFLSLHPGLTAALLSGVVATLMRPTPEPEPGEEKLIVKESTVILVMVAATVIIPPAAVYSDVLIAHADLVLALMAATGLIYSLCRAFRWAPPTPPPSSDAWDAARPGFEIIPPAKPQNRP